MNRNQWKTWNTCLDSPIFGWEQGGSSPFPLVLYIASSLRVHANLNRILYFALKKFTNNTKDSAISSYSKTGKTTKEACRETAVTEDLSEFCSNGKIFTDPAQLVDPCWATSWPRLYSVWWDKSQSDENQEGWRGVGKGHWQYRVLTVHTATTLKAEKSLPY